MGLLDAFAGPGGNSEDGVNAFGNVLGAIGAGLLTGDRYNPIGPGFIASLQANAKTGLPRAALKQILQNAGYSEADAEKLSASEGTAKLALQQKQQQTILGDGGEAEPSLFGSGGPAAPRMSPAAPSGPAAGASLNGDAATSFLNTLIGKESGGNATAKNPNSSATGLTQFTSGTWDQMMRQHPELGLTPDGRTDPEQAKRAALAYARDNAAELGKSGHEATPGNLYLGHFLGGGGATRFLNGLRNNPNAPAASYADPSAVAANRSVFYNRDGTPKSAQAFYDERTSRFGGGAPVQTADASAAAQTQPTATDAPSPGLPRLAGQPAPAELGVESNILNSPMRRTAEAGAADMPAAGSQEAGFVIPPAARETVERRVGTPPTPVNESVGPTTQRAQAIANYNYWAKRLRVSGTLGEAGKGLAEEAKQRMDLAAKFLAPTDTERLVDAAGLTGEERQRAIAGSISGNAPTDTQKNYGSYRQQELSEGRIPLSQIDYDMRLRQAGKTEVNIKNDAEKKEEVERAASVTKFLGGIADSAPATAKRASQLDMLGRLISRTRTAQGTTLRATLDGFGKELGLSSGELKTKADAINAIVNSLAPQMREPGSGTVSDADLRGFLAALPNLSATPEGNQLILGALKRATDVDRERTKIAAQWQAGKISASDARTKIGEIDERSIYASDAERSLVANLSPIPDNKAKPGWRVLGVE